LTKGAGCFLLESKQAGKLRIRNKAPVQTIKKEYRFIICD
jgi:hypothetical protein